MRRYLQYILVIAITIAMFGAIELYCRVRNPEKSAFPDHNGLWQRFQAYAMVATAPGMERATSCAASTNRAAAPSASERSDIGTVPA